MSEIRDVVIIGSGPAGYTATLCTARAQLKPLLFGSSIFVGGSLTTTTEAENFPGLPEGVDGPVLMQNMWAQLPRLVRGRSVGGSLCAVRRVVASRRRAPWGFSRTIHGL